MTGWETFRSLRLRMKVMVVLTTPLWFPVWFVDWLGRPAEPRP